MRYSNAKNERRARMQQVQWAERDFRFLARVSLVQDSTTTLCLDVRTPPVARGVGQCADLAVAAAEDDLYVAVGEMVVLRSYDKFDTMAAPVASQYEVTVRVENFWNASESGGNHGRAMRHGSMLVTGETTALSRLRGDKDVRARRLPGHTRPLDASGVRGGHTHKLAGGVSLRRVHTTEVTSGTVFAARWVCIDYTGTHARYCTAEPRCTTKTGTAARGTVLNNACLVRKAVTLHCQPHNEHDANAIELLVATPGGADNKIGFVPRGLAACLSPAMRGGLVEVSGEGVYSAPLAPGPLPSSASSAPPRHRVWFRFLTLRSGVGGQSTQDDAELARTLSLVPWWVDAGVYGA